MYKKCSDGVFHQIQYIPVNSSYFLPGFLTNSSYFLPSFVRFLLDQRSTVNFYCWVLFHCVIIKVFLFDIFTTIFAVEYEVLHGGRPNDVKASATIGTRSNRFMSPTPFTTEQLLTDRSKAELSFGFIYLYWIFNAFIVALCVLLASNIAIF